jgi:hypothetical protein
MGIFGWSYPPGCSGPPEHYSYCDLCGKDSEMCECPECPLCGQFGCLTHASPEQLAERQKQMDAEAEQYRKEDEAYAQQLKEEDKLWNS